VLGRALLIAAGAASIAAAQPSQPSSRVAFLHGHELVVRDLATDEQHVVSRNARGEVAWSGDGKLVSAGTQIVGGPRFSAQPVWAPTGETAAYVTPKAGVATWSPSGRKTVAPDGWGATSVAWSADGRLAIGRATCHVPCSVRGKRGIWVWNGLRLVARLELPPSRARICCGSTPMPVTWTAGGQVVWWSYPNSGSLAADGVALYAGTRRIGVTLMYGDYVRRCGSRLVFAAGIDRYATHGKRTVLDGRNVSRDPSRSWVSPACSADGSVLVAASGRNWEETRFGREHRAIWRLLPTREQLTHPPLGWTDESPAVLPDGSILFVRTRETAQRRSGGWYDTFRALLERLVDGKLTLIDDIGFSGREQFVLPDANFYGHYGWPDRFAVPPY
jgi:hypothetical protein